MGEDKCMHSRLVCVIILLIGLWRKTEAGQLIFMLPSQVRLGWKVLPSLFLSRWQTKMVPYIATLANWMIIIHFPALLLHSEMWCSVLRQWAMLPKRSSFVLDSKGSTGSIWSKCFRTLFISTTKTFGENIWVRCTRLMMVESNGCYY